jgi:DNA-binding transcriptional regulator PaaX
MTNLQHAILGSVAAVGLLGVALLAPNAFRMLSVLGFGKNNGRKSRMFQYSANRAVARLVDNGLLVFEKTERGVFLSLTQKGKGKLALLEANNYALKKPKRWDKKWRMVSFDIKNRKNILRNTLRDTLRQIGFTRLHQSLWVYPYPCDDLIALLKSEYKLGQEVVYVVADHIENDGFLRKTYDLSPE